MDRVDPWFSMLFKSVAYRSNHQKDTKSGPSDPKQFLERGIDDIYKFYLSSSFKIWKTPPMNKKKQRKSHQVLDIRDCAIRFSNHSSARNYDRPTTLFLKIYFPPKLNLWACLVYSRTYQCSQQQNIFFRWMNRPSDDCSRRIIFVQFWELLHTFKHFSQIINLKPFSTFWQF